MPRGVYKRESAPKAAPGAQPVVQMTQVKQVAMPAGLKPFAQLVAPEFLTQPNFFRNKRIAVDAIDGAQLKAYARSLGITQRDVDGLSEDRLRQNCKARITDSMAD
jgi:hypothetical protein